MQTKWPASIESIDKGNKSVITWDHLSASSWTVVSRQQVSECLGHCLHGAPMQCQAGWNSQWSQRCALGLNALRVCMCAWPQCKWPIFGAIMCN